MSYTAKSPSSNMVQSIPTLSMCPSTIPEVLQNIANRRSVSINSGDVLLCDCQKSINIVLELSHLKADGPFACQILHGHWIIESSAFGKGGNKMIETWARLTILYVIKHLSCPESLSLHRPV